MKTFLVAYGMVPIMNGIGMVSLEQVKNFLLKTKHHFFKVNTIVQKEEQILSIMQPLL